MAPQVRPVRNRLVIDFNDAIGRAAGQGRAGLALQFEDSCSVLIDSQLRAAGQHAIAPHAMNGLDADGCISSDHALAAIRRTADYGLAAVAARLDDGDDVLSAVQRRYGVDSGGTSLCQ